jgi:Flp pilus assembly protein TadG
MLTVLIGMTAIAIDGSRAYGLRRDMQAAVDTAALAASDKLQQQPGSYAVAEQAATTIFSANMRLYMSPNCSGYGAPTVTSPVTVTCSYLPAQNSDGTVLTQVVRALGPQGTQFQITATRNLPLQFARVLTNGTVPGLGATSTGSISNLRDSPAIAALDQAGCGGAGGSAITVGAASTLNVSGDVVSNGVISITASTLRVTGDVYSRCQSSVPGVVTACYPSGVLAPCTSPDVSGATRTGYRLADPGYPTPAVAGGSQPAPSNNAVLSPGAYASNPNFTTGKCWFLSGGVYEWLAGYTNGVDFVSNELKPPDESVAGNNLLLAANQFWNTEGYRCAGSFALSTNTDGRNPVHNGNWGVELTSVRTDTYGGVTYYRESAPSMCRTVNTATRNDIIIQISNVPGATSYNVYLALPPASGSPCSGPFGYVGNIPVTGTVSNNVISPCPIYFGGGCSLGNEQLTIDQTYLGTWAPNSSAAPDTSGALPPDPETAPLGASLPNQNPPRGVVPAGDRANENACSTAAPAFASCPNAITPGAVEFYIPSGGCLTAASGGDNYVFSGYQYNWVNVFEPAGNVCSNTFSAASNSAFIGLVYAPGASATFASANVFDSPGTGGLIFDTITFQTSLPTINYSSAYAPMPPAGRLVS